MKTTKKIFAAFLAVMMIALMIPFSASAASKDTITVTFAPYEAIGDYAANTEGTADGTYTMGIYKIANLEASGLFKAFNNDADLQNAINESNEQQILSKANELTTTTLPTASDTLTFVINSTNKAATDTTGTLTKGIYYTRMTDDKPGSVTAVANSIFVIDGVTDATTARINKVSTAAVNVTKTVDHDTIGYDRDVVYTLTASIPGSVDEKINTYVITDKMDDNLAFVSGSVKVFKGNTQLSADKYTVNTSYTNPVDEDEDVTFAVALAPAYLATDAFYAEGDIKVTFTAELKADSTVAMNTEMPNTDGLVYGNTNNLTYKPGQTVNVKTFGLKVVKVDGATNAYLAGAEFALYDDAKCEHPVTLNGKAVTATSVANGDGVAFAADGVEYKFAAISNKTYYVKETKAPNGYNLNTTVFNFVVGSSDSYTFVNGQSGVPNYKVVVPATGGMGTIIFTISGAALIAIAGVLFLVLKKKSAK